jgi:hypothetical protein
MDVKRGGGRRGPATSTSTKSDESRSRNRGYEDATLSYYPYTASKE